MEQRGSNIFSPHSEPGIATRQAEYRTIRNDPRVGEAELAVPAVARVPQDLRALAAARRYIPANVPLVKQVAAVPGDEICARGSAIAINGAWAAARRARDARGRPMPWWEGCIVLRDGMVFLLMPDPASFDGRYFGPTSRSDIVGRARLLWAR